MNLFIQKLPKFFKKEIVNFFYIIFLGVLSSFSLPPYNHFIINFITFSLFFIFLINKKKEVVKNSFFFKYGWCFGFGEGGMGMAGDGRVWWWNPMMYFTRFVSPCHK